MAFQKGNKFGKGAPKKDLCISRTLREIGHIEDDADQKTAYRRMCEGLWKRALEGDNYATTFIAERTEGKPMQSIEMEVSEPQEDPFDGLTTDELRKLSTTGR